MDDLRTLLEGIKPGLITITKEVERLLTQYWDDFDGSAEGGIQAYKLLGRLERVEWQPPRLSFMIERHGGTVNGSTRAEVQHWSVNLDARTAEIVETKPRQLYAMAPRFTTAMMREEAEELVELIERREEDVRLRSKADGRLHVVVSEIIGGGYERTVDGRRKRMRAVLVDVLGRRGWVHEGGNVFRRVEPERPLCSGPTAA